jgi:hypothetical protein
MSATKNPDLINDKWIFLFIYPSVAILMVHVGNDNSFSELLKIPSYYTDLLLAFVCTYALGGYYRWLFQRLNVRYDWDIQLRQRLIHQMVSGVILPVFVILSIEIFYVSVILHIPVRDSSILYLELPLMGIFCILINLIYLVLDFKNQPVEYTKLNAGNTPAHQDNKTSFMVHSGNKTMIIPVSEVAYFIVLRKTNFLTTTDNKEYLYNDSLESLRKELSPNDFFPLNRQFLASRQSIVSYAQTDTRKLSIQLSPAPDVPVFVSKKKASQFINWVK